MKEEVLKIIANKLNQVKTPRLHDAAKEITSHAFEFINWLGENCTPSVLLKREGTKVIYYHQWFFQKDLGEPHGELRGFFTDEEIYHHWINNVNNGK